MKTPKREELLSILSNIDDIGFEQAALSVFRYQAGKNKLFKLYLSLLKIDPESILSWEKIPHLPIQFFKSHSIKTASWRPETLFTSSSTTGQQPSKHWVRDQEWYLKSTENCFRPLYGAPSDWCFLALLPNYLERRGSSLVVMMDHFIKASRFKESGFFLNDFNALEKTLKTCQKKAQPTILLGVSFALLDFAAQFPMPLEGITIMETGGMKGKRKEITRVELHDILKSAFQIPEVHSEYGMTELFSQAYATGGKLFQPGPGMRVLTRQVTDPFSGFKPGETGVLKITDLANIDTLSFIETEDLGKVYADGRFEVLGRLDTAEIRGCNLMVE